MEERNIVFKDCKQDERIGCSCTKDFYRSQRLQLIIEEHLFQVTEGWSLGLMYFQ